MRLFLPIVVLFFPCLVFTQTFFFGNDLSYVNELEDCGVVFQEDNVPKDVHQIFADHGGNLVRLRLWHTPNWYDDLNSGQRYSDFSDVKKSIQRAKGAGMEVLLDFHLSDNWADPAKQLVPAAWLSVVDDLPLLQDSLYNYISQTLTALNADGLLPEMVQIGNETNKGILLSPDDNSVWTLEWERNAELFNTAIQAVREVESTTGKSIKIALHIAGPDNIAWLLPAFIDNGVIDFDVIGMSYYWTWHQPTTILEVGDIIAGIKSDYPEKEVMIFETSYPWTDLWNDNASNIATELNAAYSPASPDAQKRWMIDLTEEVMASGGSGVIYWEPAWVSSSCWTQWGEGSHGEHLAFFDFENNLIEEGGIAWISHDYSTPIIESTEPENIVIMLSSDQKAITVELGSVVLDSSAVFQLIDMNGRILKTEKINSMESITIDVPTLSSGIYAAFLIENGKKIFEEKIHLQK